MNADADALRPTVSVGLPVFNGERYLEQALDSILDQTFTDFELIVSDNASTDGTAEICRRYADRDRRVRYHRNAATVGGAENGNITFRLAAGRYFRLAADDDLLAPTLLERCVAVMNSDPRVVLCYPWNYLIDERGREIARVARNRARGGARWQRFVEISRSVTDCEEIYGLMRSSAMEATGLQRSYTDSDRTLLANLALLGDFAEVEEYLFSKRLHPGNSTTALPDWRQRMQWFGARSDSIVMPHWSQLAHYLSVITHSPISMADKARCYASMFGWIASDRRWGTLIKDALLAGRSITSRALIALTHGRRAKGLTVPTDEGVPLEYTSIDDSGRSERDGTTTVPAG